MYQNKTFYQHYRQEVKKKQIFYLAGPIKELKEVSTPWYINMKVNQWNSELFSFYLT